MKQGTFDNTAGKVLTLKLFDVMGSYSKQAG